MACRLGARVACVVLTNVLVGVVAALIAGCRTAPGTAPTNAPEQLGAWYEPHSGIATKGFFVTIEVGGVAGNYIAQFTENSNSLASSQPPFAIRLSGGQADERGNVTFHTGGRFQLTLGPVSGNQMTATFTDGKKITRYDMVRQGIYL